VLNAFFAIVPPTREVTALRGAPGDWWRGSARSLRRIGTAIVLVAAVLLIALGEAHPRSGSTIARAGRIGELVARWVEPGARRAGRRLHEECIGACAKPRRPEADEEAATHPSPGRQRRGWEAPVGDAKKRREPDRHCRCVASAWRPAPCARERLRKRSTPITDAALPPLSILQVPSVRPDVLARGLEELDGSAGGETPQFGVDGKVAAVNHGPVVTTFEFEPTRACASRIS
jgi:hypothetical protein